MSIKNLPEMGLLIALYEAGHSANDIAEMYEGAKRQDVYYLFKRERYDFKVFRESLPPKRTNDITDQEVFEIWEKYEAGKWSIQEAADAYDVSESAIRRWFSQIGKKVKDFGVARIDSTDVKLSGAIEHSKEGYSKRKISEYYGVSEGTVFRYFERHGHRACDTGRDKYNQDIPRDDE